MKILIIALVSLSLAGCGKSLGQVKTMAEELIGVAGKVAEDVQDNIEAVKKIIDGSTPADPEPPKNPTP